MDGRRGQCHDFQRCLTRRLSLMELREALTQITEIRLQLARTEVFRGYRAMPVAFSGGVALLAALVVWLVYRRFRRNFGQQPLRPVAMSVRIVILLIVGCLLLPAVFRPFFHASIASPFLPNNIRQLAR